MELEAKRVLVTGAGGFIGSHLTEELVRKGIRVRAFVRYNSRNSWGWLDHVQPDIKAELEIFAGDIRDPNGVLQAARDCEVIFHLAALIAIPYSYHSPDSYVDTNVSGTLNVLQAARTVGVQKLVHTSTSEVYGTACFVPITEEHPLQGQSPYSATKIGADQLALSFHRSFGTPVAVIRPFNTYGPRQSARAVLPSTIIQVASGKRTLKLGALTPTRDFNFISDTVQGFIAVATSERSTGEVINIGSCFEISIEEAVRQITDLMGVEVNIETEIERLRPQHSEVERLWADTSKAQKLLGWQPQYGGKSGFQRGLATTIAWFTLPENLAQYKADLNNV